MIEVLLLKCRICGCGAEYINQGPRTTAHQLAERDGWRCYGKEWECRCRKPLSTEEIKWIAEDVDIVDEQ